MAVKSKQVIGWCELVDLPEWGIHDLKAKIDTGARSCSLHVEDVEILPGNKIRFFVVLNRKNRRKRVIATPEKKGKVKSSIGIRTHRWYVTTKLHLGNVVRDVRINLISREDMNFRMLIGRTAIDDDFLVDAFHQYLLKKPKSDSRKVKKRKRS